GKVRQPASGNLELIQQLGAPPPGGDVEEQRPRCLRDIGDVATDEGVADIVLGQSHPPDPRIERRLVVAHPEQLGSGETGQSAVSGELYQPFTTELRLDRG